MTMRVSKDRIDMDDKVLQKPVIKDYGESVVTANSGTSYTIDLTQGNVFYITLTGNCAFMFSNPPASGTAGSFTLLLVQDSTGNRTVTWPAAVSWLGGSAPTLSTIKTHTDLLVFMTINAGTTWYGTLSAQNYDPYTPVYLQYGYLGGGNTPVYSTVDRFDYSNDTATAIAKGPLSLARASLGATGNSSYGYYGGGYISPPTIYSTVDRIDYANDTATAVVKGSLSAIKTGNAATGSPFYGYFGGGNFPTSSTVERIDYSNDTPTAAIKGPLSAARYGVAATGTSSYGYFAAGILPAVRTTIDRVDYSNDTATAVVKGPLTVARAAPAGTGSASYGYFAGGGVPPTTAVSTVDRVDYANDTVNAVAKGPLSLARSGVAASGNSAFGYFEAGRTPTAVSTIDRVDYSNDTATAVAKGPISVTRYQIASTNHHPV